MNPLANPVDIRPDHLEIVQGILREHLPEGVKVWVFGSRANWTTKDSSDLDLALESKTMLSHKLLGALKDAFEDSSLPYTVDVVDLNRIGDSFRQIVGSQRVPLSLHWEEIKHLSAGEPQEDWLYHPQFPEHWERCSLYWMAQWINGLAFRNIQFSETGMPVIKIAEIKGGISGQTKFTEQIFDESVHVVYGDLLFSWSGQPETSIDASWWKGPEGWLNQHIFRVTAAHNVDEAFFYYLLRYLKPNFVAIAHNKQTTGLGHVTKQDLEEIEAALPPLAEQRAIAHILGTLDDKIELNRRMNETLEEMARVLFKSWFVDFDPVRAKMEGRWCPGESLPGLPAHLYDLFPDRLVDSELGEIPEGWEVKALDQVATFLNGLALQKYPPNGGETLPIIRIAQLRTGSTAGADSANDQVPAEYVVHDGDLLFSWSGSLELEVWAGGIGALNQHLFKVTSDDYPKWLYYGWVLQHLTEFRNIAADKATTMGHIQRRHLTEALTVVPPMPALATMDRAVAPLLERMLMHRLESGALSTQRDTLLPRLVSGEVGLT